MKMSSNASDTCVFGLKLHPDHPVYEHLPFAHITGNRFHFDEESLKELALYLTSISQFGEVMLFTVIGFDTFIGANGKKLKVVKLEPSKEVIALFSKLDHIAIPERDGKLYLYDPSVNPQAHQKTPHITLGDADGNELEKLFSVGEQIRPSALFVKREGKYDPLLTIMI